MSYAPVVRASTLRGNRNTNMRQAREFREDLRKQTDPQEKGSYLRSVRARVRRAREFNHKLIKLLIATREVRSS